MERTPTRVLVTAFAPVPGANAHTDALVGMAAALRGDLDLVTVKTALLPHVERFGSGRMFRVPVGEGSPVEQARAFARAVDRQLTAESYDVVHTRGAVEGAVVAARRRELGYRFVYELGEFIDEAHGKEAEREWTEYHARCLDEADLVLVPTEASMRFLSNVGIAAKATVVPPGVDLDAFDWWSTSTPVRRRVLYLGAFGADRDLATVLEAVRSLRDTLPMSVLLAGEPNPFVRDRVRRMVDAFGMSEQIEVRGEPRASHYPALIRAAEVCIVSASAAPRFRDFGDLPEPLLEHLACRRAVVAAAVPGIADVVQDEEHGLLYEPGNEVNLADALRTLLTQPDFAGRLAEAGYRHVRARFSSMERRRRIAQVYEALVPGSQRYDAWQDSFDEEATGLVESPSGLAAESVADEITISTIIEDRHRGLPSSVPPAPPQKTVPSPPPAISARPPAAMGGSDAPPQPDTDPHATPPSGATVPVAPPSHMPGPGDDST